MNKEEKVIINGKEYDRKGWFNTLEKQRGGYKANIQMLDYSDVGCLMQSILSICVITLRETDAGQNYNVARALEVVINLIPQGELEALDSII